MKEKPKPRPSYYKPEKPSEYKNKDKFITSKYMNTKELEHPKCL